MADVTRRRQGELLRALFVELRKHPDGMRASDAIAHVGAAVTLTPHEVGTYKGGDQRFIKILRFSTIPCVKAGWLVKERGRWFLTEQGAAALDKEKDPEAFMRAAVVLYRAWEKGQPDPEPDDDDVIVPDPIVQLSAGITFEQAEEQAWVEIERHLTTMPPYEFQDLVAALLRGMGYHVGWGAPPGKDGGVDILAYNDPLGTRPPRIKVQVKRQQQKVSVDGLRAFMAVLGLDEVGIFVNAGGFTEDAKAEARGQQTRRVTLIDLERLVELWTEHWPRLDEGARRRMPLQPIYFLAPEG